MSLFGLSHHSWFKKKDYPLILVTGIAKTGTTAIYHSIKQALPVNSICLFEPENRALQLPEVISTPVLVKSFIPTSMAYDHFNKKILIIRDPRDQIISQMLYIPYNIVNQSLVQPEEKCEQLLQKILSLLLQKELDPGSVSVQEILMLLSVVPKGPYSRDVIEYYKSRPDVFIYKYEDFVDGKLMSLNKNLGLEIKKAGDIPEKRVIRSKSYGGWKDWFTPSDIVFFRPQVKEYMQVFGYQDNWETHSNPSIDPSVSSSYVVKLIEEAKERLIRIRK